MPKTKQAAMKTPPELAERWGVSAPKVIAFIENGELEAINIAHRNCTRPRYRISQEAIEAFERSRLVIPEIKVPKVRKKSAGNGKDYFENV